jgi:hypothetical protein
MGRLLKNKNEKSTKLVGFFFVKIYIKKDKN